MKRLLILLMIAMFVMAGCGGGDAADPGDEPAGGDEPTTETGAMPEDATDKGAIAVGDSMEGEIEDENDVHSYTLTVAEGDALELKINATGSAFTAPYIFVYDAEDALVGNTDTEKSSRSDTLELTFEAAGDYTVIVQAFDGKGEEPYALSVEAME